MAKLTHILSDLQIKRWIAKGEPVAKSDGDGLTFTLSKAGTASWILRYRAIGGRRRELTLGNYPDISLAAAREQARAKRAAVDAGSDPAIEKQESRTRAAAEWTVRDLVADYRAKVLLPSIYAHETIEYRNADIDKVVLPKFGARPVAKVTSQDIVGALKDRKDTWAISKRVLTTISKVMDHACGLQIIAANPATGIKLTAVLGPQPQVRRRVMLQTDELKILLPNIDLIGRENALAFKILLATCVRGIELVRAKKADFDLDRGTWWVPDEAVKTRNGFLVPLTPTVIGWVGELIALSGDSPFLLPSRWPGVRRKTGEQPVGRTTLWAALRKAFEREQLDITKFTPHDTRSTAKGHMRNMGVSREISEIALNHKLKGMEGIYDVRQEIPERRQALELWAQFLVECEKGGTKPHKPTGNVVPLRRAA